MASVVADDLLDRLRTGDEAPFEAVMRQHNQRLFRVARAILRRELDAEEAVQNTYIQAYLHLDQFRGESSLSTWLTRIAVREACALLRRSRHEPSRIGGPIMPHSATSDRNPEQTAMQTELRALIERATDQLPKDYRLVFVMRDVEELSTAETATCLGITEENVKIRLHRSRAMIRKRLYAVAGDAVKNVFAFDGVRCDRIVGNVLEAIRASHERGAK